MTSLTDVDPLERQRALQAFKVSVEQQPRASGPPDRDVSSNPAGQSNDRSASVDPATSRIVSSSVPTSPAQSVELSPLAFLAEVSDDDLVPPAARRACAGGRTGSGIDRADACGPYPAASSCQLAVAMR